MVRHVMSDVVDFAVESGPGIGFAAVELQLLPRNFPLSTYSIYTDIGNIIILILSLNLYISNAGTTHSMHISILAPTPPIYSRSSD
jgi:hypothetical protein